MVKKQDKEAKSELEEKVWNAISAFEQILEAMPNDRASLDALAHAYEQVGDHTRAKDYFIRLGNVIIEENDSVAGQEILDNIKQYAEDDDKARQLLARMEEFLSAKQAADSTSKAEVQSKQAKTGAADVRVSFNMADELSSAWNLLEAGELTQEEYASIVQDLTEMSAGDSNATISVLHVLEVRAFKSLEKIMGFIARECSSPIISLASFDLQPSVLTMLPMEFMIHRGALVFELLGNNALVVVMNPYSKQLRQDVEAATGKKCHFFITLSSEFDQAIAKIPQILSEKH
jgi:tetratricopeptide (TPR) repeat protein